MARRNPMNERYQKHAKVGSTRKSASSTKLGKPGGKKKKRERERPRIGLVPQTPEMKKWRRIWWVLIGIALLFAGSILLPPLREVEWWSQVALVLEFIALGGAVYIDWKIIRPLRQQAVEQAKKERREGK